MKMKLWITTQDGASLFQTNNVLYILQNNKHTILIRFNVCNTEILGEYSSKKRCLEIIEEITQKLVRAKSETIIYKMPKN
jgi:hypothetical protein